MKKWIINAINNHAIKVYKKPSKYLSATANKLFGNFTKKEESSLSPIFTEIKWITRRKISKAAIP